MTVRVPRSLTSLEAELTAISNQMYILIDRCRNDKNEIKHLSRKIDLIEKEIELEKEYKAINGVLAI